MVNCPACEADIDVDDEVLQEGSVVSCGGCGARCEIVTLHPLEVERLAADDDDEDEEDEDLDDEDLDDEDEEEDEDGYDDEEDELDPDGDE